MRFRPEGAQLSAPQPPHHRRRVDRSRAARRSTAVAVVLGFGGVVAPLVASGAESESTAEPAPHTSLRPAPPPAYTPPVHVSSKLGMFGGYRLDLLLSPPAATNASVADRNSTVSATRRRAASAGFGSNPAAVPLPSTLPSSVAAAVVTARVAAEELEQLHAIILAEYAWGERSLRVAELQAAVGTVVDGRYGSATRRAHVAALEWTRLPTDGVPAQPPRPVASSGGPSAAAWAALRRCESSGNYSIVNRSGKYRGAYQFDQTTWNDVARRHRPHLVGRDPAAAAPGDQDAMARSLYGMRGARPWPECGRHLR